MKSSIKRRTYKAIYRLLDRVSPVEGDCGELCGAICCTYGDVDSTGCNKIECEDSVSQEYSDDDMGIYLLPGEEKLFDGEASSLMKWEADDAENYDFPDSWHGKVYFVKCKNPPHCDRHMRPMQCRTYPVLPHYLESGELVLILSDVDTPYKCPLISENIRLTPPFLKATHTVWKHLAQDRLINDLIALDSSYREDDEVQIVYIDSGSKKTKKGMR